MYSLFNNKNSEFSLILKINKHNSIALGIGGAVCFLCGKNRIFYALFSQFLSFKCLRIRVPNFCPQTPIPECFHVVVQISVTFSANNAVSGR